jgi:hypothetical protein
MDPGFSTILKQRGGKFVQGHESRTRLFRHKVRQGLRIPPAGVPGQRAQPGSLPCGWAGLVATLGPLVTEQRA